MTDENLNVDGSIEQSQQADSFTQNLDSPASQQAPQAEQAQKQEKYVPQTEVNTIVASERKKAYEKGLNSAMHQAKPEQTQTEQPSQAYDQGNVNIDQQVDRLLNQKLSEMQTKHQAMLERQEHEAAVSQVEGSLKLKMDEARKEIDGYDETLASVGYFDRFPGIKYAASQFENGGKILHYLADNAHEIAGVENVAMIRDSTTGAFNVAPALKIFKRISDSIALNDNGKKSQKAPSPISQIETNTRDGFGDKPIGLEDWKTKLTT